MDEPELYLSLKKTYFYTFIPSKAEEEACIANNTPWVTTRELIEIRDIYPPPKIDINNPWKIKKVLDAVEVDHGKIVVPYIETFEYVIRYWNLEVAKVLVKGDNVVLVGLWDATEQNNPKKYQSESVYFEQLPDDYYALACMDLFKDRGLRAGDEIGLYWDPRSSTFQFKLLSLHSTKDAKNS